jgi:putative ABC transport system ATP-binding protein
VSTIADPTQPMASEGAEVRTIQLVKTYSLSDGRRLNAVDHGDLMIVAGTVTALVGPSGSGKSTLLHLMGAIDTVTSGSVEVDGVNISTLRKGGLARYRRSVGFIFQQFHLLPALTALDNVLAPVLPIRTSFDKKARAQQLLDAVGLAGRERSLPAKLSGGQQQRVAIARALINEPRLILADEPTGNLDSQTAHEIIGLMLSVSAERGTTIVLATHDREVADRCGSVISIRDGRPAG